jgi:helix-turn-helix protein
MKESEKKIEQNFVLLEKQTFEDLTNQVRFLTDFIKKCDNQIYGKDWLTEGEVQKLLGVKTTTLWKLRSEKKLLYSKIGKKIFYQKKSIEALLYTSQ